MTKALISSVQTLSQQPFLLPSRRRKFVVIPAGKHCKFTPLQVLLRASVSSVVKSLFQTSNFVFSRYPLHFIMMDASAADAAPEDSAKLCELFLRTYADARLFSLQKEHHHDRSVFEDRLQSHNKTHHGEQNAWQRNH